MSGSTQGGVRDRLLVAAEELFYAQGIQATGVDRVVERAQVAVASLYRLFGDKEGLVAAYLRDRDERWLGVWDRHLEADDDPRTRVLALFVALDAWRAEASLQRGCACLAALAQVPADHPQSRLAAELKRRTQDRQRDLVAVWLEDPASAELVSETLISLYEGELARSALDPSGGTRPGGSVGLASAVLDGLLVGAVRP